MPDLQTDEAGNVVIKFKMNEALTRWKFQLFAHTKALEMATSTKAVLTQKELINILRYYWLLTDFIEHLKQKILAAIISFKAWP